MAEDSGNIVLEGDIIRYCSRTYGSWELPVSTVRIIGEATNQDGPWWDDYFLCFAAGPDRWHEASFYAAGRDLFLDALSQRLGTRLELGLAHSTNFASRVLWPPALAGQPMFRFTDVPPRTQLGKLFGPTRNTQTYTDAALAFLSEHT